MPKKSWRVKVDELAVRNNHAGVVSLCSHALRRRDGLERGDRIYALRMQARHLAAINPVAWQRQIKSALGDALIEAAGDADLEASLLTALSAADIPLRIPQEIADTVRRFEALAERHPDVRIYGKGIYFNLAYVHEMAGEYQPALENYRRSLEICRQCGADREAGEALHNIAHTYVRMGRLEEATAAATEARSLLPEGHGAAKVSCLMGKIARRGGDLDTARSLFEEGLSHPGADERTRVDILAAWAEMELAAGRPEVAGDLARGGLQMAYRLPYPEGAEELNNLAARIGGEE